MLSWPVVWTLSSPVTIVFYGFQGDGKHSVLALKRLVRTLSWPVVWTLGLDAFGRHF